jgi:hypothetical protein
LVNVYFVAEEGIHQHQGEAQVANTMTWGYMTQFPMLWTL